MRSWPRHAPAFAIRDARIDGVRARHLLIHAGRIIDFPETIDPGVPTIDARGGRVMPGLVDHHLHLMAAAVREHSVDLSSIVCGGELNRALRQASARGAVRAIGYDDGVDGALDRWALDALSSTIPIRVQYRTGTLWVLNSAALDHALQGLAEVPETFERGARGELNGRVWHSDQLLRARPTNPVPSLASLGCDLARWGITAVTDASASTDQAQADALALAAGDMPQEITLMSRTQIKASCDGVRVGPVKIMLHEDRLPLFEELTRLIKSARVQGRSIAAHCVTPAELALFAAALDACGGRAGDRIEHGSLIPPDYFSILRDLGVTVVTQPAFVYSRGDRYLRDVPTQQCSDLYRAASLMDHGIPLAAGSDAPYGPLNPWLAIRSAAERRTSMGASLGAQERLGAEQALALYLGAVTDPGGPRRRVEIGAPADLCLLKAPGHGDDDDPVAMTFKRGDIIYACNGRSEGWTN